MVLLKVFLKPCWITTESLCFNTYSDHRVTNYLCYKILSLRDQVEGTLPPANLWFWLVLHDQCNRLLLSVYFLLQAFIPRSFISSTHDRVFVLIIILITFLWINLTPFFSIALVGGAENPVHNVAWAAQTPLRRVFFLPRLPAAHSCATSLRNLVTLWMHFKLAVF